MFGSVLKTKGLGYGRPNGAEDNFDAGPGDLAAHIGLLDLAADAIFACDAERRITFWNRGAQGTYGFTSKEALGAVPGDLLRTEYPIPLDEMERLVTNTGGWEGKLVQ